jgi:hypothetical protein
MAKESRTFLTTTADLIAMSEWLAENKCTHVAMEATGVYWKPVWHILADAGFGLVLANAAHIKNVPGRKTDVKDADWISELLAHGLIRASFVPDGPTQEIIKLPAQETKESLTHPLYNLCFCKECAILSSEKSRVLGTQHEGDQTAKCKECSGSHPQHH